MILKRSFIPSAALLAAFFYLSGMVVFPLVPKAFALYWEDEEEGNDPKEIRTRPSHFSLFDWVGDLDKAAKEKHYREMDDQDKGPEVNNGARTMEIISSGVVGMAIGLVLANRVTTNPDDYTTNYFIGGAIGFGVGIGIGALIMPRDYEVDRMARLDYLKYRQAWLQDPVKLQVAKSFRPTPLSLSFKF